MSKTRFALLVVLSPLALLPSASAQAPQSPETSGSPLQTITGKIMTAHDDTLVIETEAGEERAFVMDANVTVPEAASPGHRVTVTYRSPGGARAFAVGVRLEKEELQPPKDEGDQGPLLPRTAGLLPLVALTGLTALVGSVALRAALGGTD